MAEHITDWSQFVTEHLFDVTDVTVTTDPIRVERGEMRIGREIKTSLSGYKLLAEISVESENSPVNTLKFLGSPHIEAGDQIKVYMVAASRYTYLEAPTNVYDNGVRTAYKNRELENIEEAFKIEKLGVNGKILATYISTDIRRITLRETL